MRHLHITNWYPSAREPWAAPFIERQVKALRTQGEHDLWHVQVVHGPRWRLIRKPGTTTASPPDRTFLLVAPVRRWYIIEWLTFLLIAWAWITRPRGRHYASVDLIIAYPSGVRITWLKRLFRRPVVFTEHWSAYHFDFHGASKGVDRARRIFTHGVPVVCVSQALADDIRTFARVPSLETPIIDNVVDVERFAPADGTAFEEGRFFAVSLWRRPKRPEVMVEALALLRRQGRPARLRLAGDGPELEPMRALIARLGLDAHVDLLGRLAPERIADEMRRAHALWHCSDYETFSVVCAEALCCGTPVITSRVGGIPGFVDADNGTLVEANDPEVWARSVDAAWDIVRYMDRPAIAARMRDRFCERTVGRRFQAVLDEVATHTAR